MLNIKTTYFLTKAGKLFFPHWFHKVILLTSQQDGFLSISCDLDALDNPVIYLEFENLEKLNTWSSCEQHEKLVSEIEKYYIQPQQTILAENI